MGMKFRSTGTLRFTGFTFRVQQCRQIRKRLAGKNSTSRTKSEQARKGWNDPEKDLLKRLEGFENWNLCTKYLHRKAENSNGAKKTKGAFRLLSAEMKFR
jgi:hypothetical protein